MPDRPTARLPDHEEAASDPLGQPYFDRLGSDRQAGEQRQESPDEQCAPKQCHAAPLSPTRTCEPREPASHVPGQKGRASRNLQGGRIPKRPKEHGDARQRAVRSDARSLFLLTRLR